MGKQAVDPKRLWEAAEKERRTLRQDLTTFPAGMCILYLNKIRCPAKGLKLSLFTPEDLIPCLSPLAFEIPQALFPHTTSSSWVLCLRFN
jgi:hypothetical protein